jgi:hypothetical protein
MLRRLLAAAAALLLYVQWSSAQPSGAAPNMPVPGDYWIYDVKDEISGEIESRKFIVTDVSNGEIAVRTESETKHTSDNLLFDELWNLKHSSGFKYSPNNGMGLQFPLTLDSRWEISIGTTNLRNGQNWRCAGTSRITGHERITAKAGDFDTFVIETSVTYTNGANPTRQQQVVIRSWYNADVNHPVRRNYVLRENGHVFRSETMELTDYGKKKS